MTWIGGVRERGQLVWLAEVAARAGQFRSRLLAGLTPALMRQRIAHEVEPSSAARLSSSASASAILVPSPASELASLAPRRLRRVSLRRSTVRNVSASGEPYRARELRAVHRW